jgi:trehalose 6-phosphate synthase
VSERGRLSGASRPLEGTGSRPLTTLGHAWIQPSSARDGCRHTDAPLLLVANRLPLARQRGVWRPSSGGLVTALTPVVERVGGRGSAGTRTRRASRPRVDGLNCDLHAVDLEPELVEGYYHGFTNRTLWPLFHDLVVQPVIDRSWWRSYVTVTSRFADKVSEVIEASPTAARRVDPGLPPAPAPAAAARPLPRTCASGCSCTSPSPRPSCSRACRGASRCSAGCSPPTASGSTRRSTATTSCAPCSASSQTRPCSATASCARTAARVRALSHPISIDAEDFSTLARDPATDAEVAALREQFGGRKVLLGVDRLDYTKGIRHRLQAIELLLEQRPHLRGRFVFVQIAVPSRDDVEEYRSLRTQVETEVGRINGRFTEPGHDVPVHYLHRSIDRTRLAAYYRLADVMCVTPLKDGMNLVAKEFVTVRDATDGDGVLVLSEFCGTAHEFGHDAVRCNPFDVEGLATLLEGALELAPDDRRAASLAWHRSCGTTTSSAGSRTSSRDRRRRARRVSA